jgi:hypothetical protein
MPLKGRKKWEKSWNPESQKISTKTEKECNVGKGPKLSVSLSGSNRSALTADLLAVHNKDH